MADVGSLAEQRCQSAFKKIIRLARKRDGILDSTYLCLILETIDSCGQFSSTEEGKNLNDFGASVRKKLDSYRENNSKQILKAVEQSVELEMAAQRTALWYEDDTEGVFRRNLYLWERIKYASYERPEKWRDFLTATGLGFLVSHGARHLASSNYIRKGWEKQSQKE